MELPHLTLTHQQHQLGLHNSGAKWTIQWINNTLELQLILKQKILNCSAFASILNALYCQ